MIKLFDYIEPLTRYCGKLPSEKITEFQYEHEGIPYRVEIEIDIENMLTFSYFHYLTNELAYKLRNGENIYFHFNKEFISTDELISYTKDWLEVNSDWIYLAW